MEAKSQSNIKGAAPTYYNRWLKDFAQRNKLTIPLGFKQHESLIEIGKAFRPALGKVGTGNTFYFPWNSRGKDKQTLYADLDKYAGPYVIDQINKFAKQKEVNAPKGVKDVKGDIIKIIEAIKTRKNKPRYGRQQPDNVRVINNDTVLVSGFHAYNLFGEIRDVDNPIDIKYATVYKSDQETSNREVVSDLTIYKHELHAVDQLMDIIKKNTPVRRFSMRVQAISNKFRVLTESKNIIVDLDYSMPNRPDVKFYTANNYNIFDLKQARNFVAQTIIHVVSSYISPDAEESFSDIPDDDGHDMVDYTGVQFLNISVSYVPYTKPVGEQDGQVSKRDGLVYYVRKSTDYKNCLFRLFDVYGKQDDDFLCRALDKALAKNQDFDTTGIELDKDHLESLARSLQLELRIYTPLARITGSPYITCNNTQHRAILKVFVRNNHAHKYETVPDFDQIKDIKHSYDTSEIYNDPSIGNIEIDQDGRIIAAYNDTTYYKAYDPCSEFKPTEQANPFEYIHVKSREKLIYRMFTGYLNMKKTYNYSVQYQESMRALGRGLLSQPQSWASRDVYNCAEFDLNKAYLSAHTHPLYKGFPTNTKAIMIECDAQYYEQNKKSISIVALQNIKITSDGIAAAICQTFIRGATALWVHFAVYESIKHHISADLTHCIIEEFAPQSIAGIFDNISGRLNTPVSKLEAVKTLGLLVSKGTTDDMHEMSLDNLTLDDYNLVCADICAYQERTGVELRYITEQTGPNSFNISFNTNKPQHKYSHVISAVYGYAVSMMLDAMFKLAANGVRLISYCVDAIHVEPADAEKAQQVINIGNNYGQFKHKLRERPVNIFSPIDPQHVSRENAITTCSASLYRNIDTTKVQFISLAAGIGKNHNLYNMLRGATHFKFLTFTNARRAQIVDELIAAKVIKARGDAKYSVLTISKFLGVSILAADYKSRDGLDKYLSVTRFDERYHQAAAITVIDEFSLCNRILIDAVMDRVKGSKIFIIGDTCQTDLSFDMGKVDLNYAKSKDMAIINELPTHYPRNDNMRQDVELGTFFDSLRDMKCGAEMLGAFIEKYKPRRLTVQEAVEMDDIIIMAPIWAQNAYFNNARVEYAKRAGKSIRVCTDKKAVCQSNNFDIIQHKTSYTDKLSSGKKYWSAHAMCVNSLQGVTLDEQSPWGSCVGLLAAAVYEKKYAAAVYTILTRVRRADQIYIIE